MIIVSQDGMTQVPVEGMIRSVNKNEKTFEVISVCMTFSDGYVSLGIYSTKERALEVMDEITKKYEEYFFRKGGTKYVTGETIYPLSFNPPKVYIMPQDKE